MNDALCLIGSAWATAGEVAEAVAPATGAVPIGDAWSQLLSTVIVAFMIPTTGYAAVLAREWIKAKVAKIKNDERRAAAEFAVQRLDRIVTNVVKEIEQKKETGAHLTKEETGQLLTDAYNGVKAQMSDDITAGVKTVVNDLDRYILTKIEAAVRDQKLFSR